MKLYTKLALFNTISKALVFIAFFSFLPIIVKQVVFNHTDERLLVMKERVLGIVNRVGISTFIQEEGDSSYSSYNILKEEFISLEPASDTTSPFQRIENTQRNIENSVVDYRVLSYVFKMQEKNYLLEIGKSTATITELDQTIKKFALYVLLLILTITVLIDVGYAKQLLKPFQRIIEKKLKGVKHPADFDFREIQTTTTDFKYLDKSINEMMEKINAAFQREKEITSNISHELLTPISLLQSRLENIMSDPSISENAALKVIESQKTLVRLNKIITAFLMIARIENEQYLKEEAVNINLLINEVIDEIEERFEEKHIKIQIKYDAEYVFQQGNKSLLFTLFFNLINNAIKYNVTEGMIIIHSKIENGKFKVEVKDTGIGIDAEQQKVIFNRFRKHQSTDTRSYGLGLPIVRAIADFHGIEIVILANQPRGTSFVLIFP